MKKDPEISSVPARVTPAAEQPMDIERRFGFTRTEIEMGPDGAYTIDGTTVYAYGPGAIRLGREAGVCIIKPAMIRVGESIHPNPHVEYDLMGQPSVLHMVKHGIMVDRSGSIRYVAPIYERIDIAAYIAERAMKAKQSKYTPPADARFCTRVQAEAWNKEAKEPGDPVWWFVATIGTETGVAFNLNSGEKQIRNLVNDIIHFRKNILRRFETATDRRVIWSLVYESMVAIRAQVEQVKTSAESEYTRSVVRKAVFMVDKPTRGGLELGLLQELGIAIREDNAQKRERLLEAFRGMTGLGEVRVVESAAATDVPEPVTVEGEIEDAAEAGLEPMPPKGNLADRRAWLQALLPRLTADERARVVALLGPDPTQPGDDQALAAALTRENARELAALVRGFIDARESPPPAAGPGPDEMKAYLLEQMAEGSVGRIEGLMEAAGLARDASLDIVPDETIRSIYNAYVGGTGLQAGGGEAE